MYASFRKIIILRACVSSLSFMKMRSLKDVGDVLAQATSGSTDYPACDLGP
jgi:hypothetical protein